MVAGSVRYLVATRLLITADGGGSNRSRLRLWKLESQKLAGETGLQRGIPRLAECLAFLRDGDVLVSMVARIRA